MPPSVFLKKFFTTRFACVTTTLAAVAAVFVFLLSDLEILCLYDVERQLCNTINIVLLQNSTVWKIELELEAWNNVNCITSTVILLHNYNY